MTKNTIKFDVFIKGKLVDLVVLTEEIVEKTNWYNWFNDEKITKNMQKHYYPNTKEMQMSFLRNEVEGNSKKLQLGIVNKKDQVIIGTISLSNIDYMDRKCSIACMIGEAKYQSFKYFLEANQLLIKHAFEQLNMNKIKGGALTEDLAHLHYKFLRFKEEGVLREEVYKDGKFRDVYLFSLFKEVYYSQKQ